MTIFSILLTIFSRFKVVSALSSFNISNGPHPGSPDIIADTKGFLGQLLRTTLLVAGIGPKDTV